MDLSTYNVWPLIYEIIEVQLCTEQCTIYEILKIAQSLIPGKNSTNMQVNTTEYQLIEHAYKHLKFAWETPLRNKGFNILFNTS